MKWQGLMDTHAHLDYPAFDNDREEVISKVKEAGFSGIINVGTDIESSQKTIILVKNNPGFIWGAVGIHPHHASEINGDSIKELKSVLALDGIVALGEMGLDYHYDHSPRINQSRVFSTQLRLARSVGKPVIIHCREAEKDLIELLKEEKAGEIGGVMHCFAGDIAMAKKCLDLGLYLGLGGVLTFANAHSLREIANYIPLESILLETDCPYLAPVPKRGKRNEPLFTGYVAEKLAEIKKVSLEKIIAVTTANAKKLFRI